MIRKIGNLNHGLQVVINVEDVILRLGLEAQIVEVSEQLGAMIGTVVDNMEQHLPDSEALIFFRFCDGFIEQHLIGQVCQISTHVLLNPIPMGA